MYREPLRQFECPDFFVGMYREPYKQLKTDFSNGHSGDSGRFAGFRDSAYRFVFDFKFLTISVFAIKNNI